MGASSIEPESLTISAPQGRSATMRRAVFGYLVARRTWVPGAGSASSRPMKESRDRPCEEAHGHQQIAVHLLQHVAAHDAAVGDAVADVERQVPILQGEHLDPLLREPRAQAAAGAVEAVEADPGRAEGGERGVEVPPLGQRQPDHGRSRLRLQQSLQAEREAHRRHLGAEGAEQAVVAPAAAHRQGRADRRRRGRPGRRSRGGPPRPP